MSTRRNAAVINRSPARGEDLPVRWFAVLLGIATLCGWTAEPSHAQERSATVTVEVRSAGTGQPIPGAQVTFPATGRGGVTNASGVVRFGDVTAGTHVIEVRYVGFRSFQYSLDLATGQTVRVSIPLEMRPIALSEVRAQAKPRAGTLANSGFLKRKKRGIGHFISRADIDRQRPRRFSDLLRMVPGTRLTCASMTDNCLVGMSAAPPSLSSLDQRFDEGTVADLSCPVQYYVDGAYQPQPDVNLIRPEDIEAVEVYTHGHGAPARYSIRKNARCGVILIWMRLSLNTPR